MAGKTASKTGARVSCRTVMICSNIGWSCSVQRVLMSLNTSLTISPIRPKAPPKVGRRYSWMTLTMPLKIG